MYTAVVVRSTTAAAGAETERRRGLLPKYSRPLRGLVVDDSSSTTSVLFSLVSAQVIRAHAFESDTWDLRGSARVSKGAEGPRVEHEPRGA